MTLLAAVAVPAAAGASTVAASPARASAAAVLAASPSPAADDTTVVPALGAKLADCETGVLPVQRIAEFSGAMPAVAGATRLAMRFDLQQRRSATATWKPLAAPSFGRFEHATAGAAGFVYVKRVERLAVDSSYRVTVRFRWTAADGAVVKRATRASPACKQADVRPDVGVLDATTGTPLGDGRARYVVRVRNSGLGALLQPLRVTLAVDGAPLPAQSVPTLLPGAVVPVSFDGPACAAGGSITATADPADGVEEPDEADNALIVACP